MHWKVYDGDVFCTESGATVVVSREMHGTPRTDRHGHRSTVLSWQWRVIVTFGPGCTWVDDVFTTERKFVEFIEMLEREALVNHSEAVWIYDWAVTPA